MKKIFTLLVMLCAAMGMQAQDTWTIAGEKTLMGVHWDPAAEENNMSTTDGKIYTLVKENVMLQAGAYEFKACPNHGWDGAIGDGEGNAKVTIDADGAYTVTFTLDVENSSLEAIGLKTGDYQGSDEVKWVVAGAEELMGVHWDGASEDNKMSSSDGKIYTLTKTDIPLNIETPYQYKFVKDESAWYGLKDGVVTKEDGNANFELFVEEAGIYTVVFTLNTENMTAGVETTKTGEATFGEKTWTICGQKDLCGNDWDPAFEDNDMEKIEDGYFELTRYNVTLEAKTYEYKVAANHSWGESYGGDTANGNQWLVVDEAGTYDVTFSFIVATKTLDALLEPASGAGIYTTKANLNNTTVIFNLQGQRVKAGYRGIAIKNGRKMIVK